MFSRFRIRNFRGFDDLSVDRLSRINLVTGRNNSGKTTLLEAVFMLSSAGDPQAALKANVIRGVDLAAAPAVAETFWKPLFTALDMNKTVEIAGQHKSLGSLSLSISLERSGTVELPFEDPNGAPMPRHAGANGLLLTFKKASAPEVEGRMRLSPNGIQIESADSQPPFQSMLLSSRAGSHHDDATRLGQLRTRKQGDLVLDALATVEARLKSVEDNTASGSPMIWGDIGLPELVPLPLMGEGMTRIARIILAISATPDGVVLIDEIENGLHHAALGKVWQSIETAANQFNTQVIASTHSFECVEAAYRSLDNSSFLVHRLEEVDDRIRCVSYEPEEIEAAVSHSLEVR
ncbi:MAG: AAA family ATPase [Defluviicoccus sp.]|nr:AAA family ATPase [Defluviicoccus sp.]